ncbi:CopG family transcriptional regulator [Sphaerimonospora cavernae]|uniref:CopG family transcriptional regulator n=1 Tax=Sphaerimonospora cavernae TaxID=1740611 RepID=A0ABV6U152_9ACTN
MRTTVYLSADAKHRLSQAARRRHRSEAELIREAIDRLLADEPARPTATLPVFDALDASLPDRVEEELAAGFGADGFSWSDLEDSDATSDR